MPIHNKTHGKFNANAYLVWRGSDAVLIDPPEQLEDLLAFMEDKQLQLRALLCTHMHIDHVPGFAAWQRATGLTVLAGAEDIAARESMWSRAVPQGLDPIEPFRMEALAPGRVYWGGLGCDVILVPGHSPGSLCFYFFDEAVLVSGDTLYYRTVGRDDFPESLPGLLKPAIRERLYVLPPETAVYPGHGKPSTIGAEMRLNPECPAQA